MAADFLHAVITLGTLASAFWCCQGDIAARAGLSLKTLQPESTLTTEAKATSYYMAPGEGGGNDANSGLSPQAPWLSPNHRLNCGDVIYAKPGVYNHENFYTGKWGKVNCPTGDNVAWLTCQTFDKCKISTTSDQGMWVDQSYWGVQGWEISTSPSDLYGTCFIAQPNWVAPTEIHHIIFANDIANGCSQSGFAVVNHGAVSVDYFAVVGTIAYNTSQGSGTCASGITIYQPVQSDSLPGTHLYIAGNFSYANLEPSQCNGTPPTDGEGIILDTFDGSQGGLPSPYAAQAVVENNIVAGNGGKGIEVANNTKGSSHATVYINQNTSWGNLIDRNQGWSGCGEIAVTEAFNTHVTNNLVATRSASDCGGHAIFAIAIAGGDASDTVTHNYAFGFGGNNTFSYKSASFSFGETNTLGVSPVFSTPRVTGPPTCEDTANVAACMASMIKDFIPTAPAAAAYGYQVPKSTSAANPLFPKWLCHVHLPEGLITSGCEISPPPAATASANSAGPASR